MAGRNTYSSDGSLSTLPSRLFRKVSDSVTILKVTKRTRFESDETAIHHPLRRTSKFSFEGDERPGRPLRRHSALNIDGSHDSYRGSSVDAASTNPFRRRHSHTLETVIEVPSNQTSRRTTIANASRSATELVEPLEQATPVIRAHVDEGSGRSDMHQSVKSGDYLLARGANPRTGVVTPAHSANNSLGDNAAISDAQCRPARWRQKGDQWISLDFGEPTPSITTVSEKMTEHHYPVLRTPQKLKTEEQRHSLRNSSGGHVAYPSFEPEKPTVTLQIDKSPALPAAHEEHPTQNPPNLRIESPVKRKPVGSPPSRSVAAETADVQASSEDSSDTVLRNLMLRPNLRSSSAPGSGKGFLLDAQAVDKDLPKLPGSSMVNGKLEMPGENPFLESQGTLHARSVPSPGPSIIPEPQAFRKELPCLPMSNGQSLSKSAMPPYPVSPTKVAGSATEGHQPVRLEIPRGPREGGDPAYPYIRTARTTYPVSPPINRQHPIGERGMPVPVYDNPPKPRSQLQSINGPATERPRPMPMPMMSVPEKTRLALNPLWNTTTTPTGTSTNKLGLPRPLQIGPPRMIPDFRLNRGPHGFHHKDQPFNKSDIIMNTSMNMNADSMMSIPMPRVRPRAMTRPAMPMRAEGMYGVPRIEAGRERANSTGLRSHSDTKEGTIPAATVEPYHEMSLVPERLNHKVLKGQVAVQSEEQLNQSGLTRKCSRCDHGFVDVNLHNTDSVIHMLDRLKDIAEAKEETTKLHPGRSPLPCVPELARQPNSAIMTHQKGETDERDHTICCPQCCKLDCHEGCLGHPSPTSSPSPTNTTWSVDPTLVDTSGTATPSSEPELVERIRFESHAEKARSKGMAFFKSVLKSPTKLDQESKSGTHLQAVLAKRSFEVLVHPPSPTRTPSQEAAARRANAAAVVIGASKSVGSTKPSEAIPAAVIAMNPTQRKTSGTRPIMHRRQRSNSLPTIGFGISNGKTSSTESQRAISTSRLRIPSPLELALSCISDRAGKNGFCRSRNASGASVATIEVQIPNLSSLTTGGGYTALTEILFVPLEATKMWIKTHPQVLTLGNDLSKRAWEMLQLMIKTAWRVWAIVFVYSKTGKIKFHVGKGETATGFMTDLARSTVYFLIFAAVSALVVRVLGLVFGVVRVGLWFCKGVFWVVGSILGIETASK